MRSSDHPFSNCHFGNLPSIHQWCLALVGLLVFIAVTVGAASGIDADEPTRLPKLSRSQEISGWELLFDGKTTQGWRSFKRDEAGPAWQVIDGQLVRGAGDAGDLITKEKFRWFELSLEYKISPGGNSGVMFHVSEAANDSSVSGPEVQIRDNAAGYAEQKQSGVRSELSGWLYGLYRPYRSAAEGKPLDATRAVGKWNQIYLRVSPDQSEVCVNGMSYFRFKLGSDDWNRRVANSKFARLPLFGKTGEGHLCLQDYGNEIAFRNIQVRRLGEDGNVKQPIDGKLSMVKKLAFPRIRWDQWEGFDDSGRVRPLRLLELTYADDGSNHLYAISQHGGIWRFENRHDVEKTSLFLDLRGKVTDWQGPRCNEQGLLGLAFHPHYKDNGYFYVCYTDVSGEKSVVSRFSVSKDDPNVADPDSEHVLMEIPQPYKNHNGGSIEFGPDGYLYIGMGDGGFRNDPHGNGQNLGTLLGSILRIDVDRAADGRPYGIPDDNPFVNQPGARAEIFAYGIRNPWKLAFDQQTGRLWAGEVGQDLWEEVIVVEKGGNYGWSRREGNHPFGRDEQPSDHGELIDPVWEYDHQIGKSITGGRVYRSQREPELTGKYLYADYVSGRVWALTYDSATGQASRNEQVISESIPVLAFGEDPSGEVFLLTESARGDSIYRFESKDRR